jgi:hypothetical protein
MSLDVGTLILVCFKTWGFVEQAETARIEINKMARNRRSENHFRGAGLNALIFVTGVGGSVV